MKKNNYEKVFDAFLNGELNSEELISFREKIEGNSEFKNAFEIHKKTIAGIIYSKERKIKSTLTTVQNELEEEGFFDDVHASLDSKSIGTKTKIINFRSIFSIAASLLILIGAALYFYAPTDDQPSSKELFAQFYSSEKSNLPLSMDKLDAQGFASASDESNKILLAALKNYESSNYKQANIDFVNYLEEHPNNKTAKFYWALTLVELKDFSLAAEKLMDIAKNNESEFSNKAIWYAALAYGQVETSEGKEKSQQLLKEIASNNKSEFAAKAKQYLMLNTN